MKDIIIMCHCDKIHKDILLFGNIVRNDIKLIYIDNSYPGCDLKLKDFEENSIEEIWLMYCPLLHIFTEKDSSGESELLKDLYTNGFKCLKEGGKIYFRFNLFTDKQLEHRKKLGFPLSYKQGDKEDIMNNLDRFQEKFGSSFKQCIKDDTDLSHIIDTRYQKQIVIILEK
jgi:hypothetical protein